MFGGKSETFTFGSPYAGNASIAENKSAGMPVPKASFFDDFVGIIRIPFALLIGPDHGIDDFENGEQQCLPSGETSLLRPLMAF